MAMVSMWMLIVAVAPHHHHAFCESVCLQHDADSDIAHHGDQNDDLCHTTCITNIRSVSPDRVQDHVSPDFTYLSDLFLATENVVSSLLESGGSEASKETPQYHERLHAQWSKGAIGRRGPPAVG
jgi:hypothetical protein